MRKSIRNVKKYRMKKNLEIFLVIMVTIKNNCTQLARDNIFYVNQSDLYFIKIDQQKFGTCVLQII